MFDPIKFLNSRAFGVFLFGCFIFFLLIAVVLCLWAVWLTVMTLSYL